MNHSIDYEQLIDNLKVNIVWKDLTCRYVGANQHFLNIVGLTAEEISGKTDYDLTTADLAKKIIENDQEVFSVKEARAFREYIIDQEGCSKVYLSYKTPLFDQNQQLFGLTTLAIDMTELYNKESRLISESHSKSSYIDSMSYFDEIATMFNQMTSDIPANIFWKNKQGIFLGCNDANTRMINTQGAQSIIGKTLQDLFPKKMADKLEEPDLVVLSQGESVILEEIGPHIGGGLATYLTNKGPVRNDKGEIIGLIGISIDITEEKRIEQSLRDATKKAKAADQAKADFIRNMSHDIRTPLMGILGFSEILESQETDPAKKESFGYIRHSAQRLLSWMNEITEIVSSVEESGDSHCAINLDQLMEGLTELMCARIEIKKLQWIVNIDSEIPKNLTGDLRGLQGILLNLVGNATKFIEEGSVSVEAKLVSRQDDKVIIDIIVSDTGIGIPKDKFTEIFKKFSRLSSSYSGKYPGSGLGLYSISQIVERMGGTVEVESTVGKGSKFTCRLPFNIK